MFYLPLSTEQFTFYSKSFLPCATDWENICSGIRIGQVIISRNVASADTVHPNYTVSRKYG